MSYQDLVKSTILTDIDSLLDTRLPLVEELLSKQAYDVLLTDRKWHTRLIETVDGLDYDAYLDAYAKRDMNTLTHSNSTNVLEYISELLLGIKSDCVATPFKFSPKIMINMYPYELDDVIQGYIIDSVKEVLLVKDIEIEFIDVDIKELYPSVLTSLSVGVVISYAVEPWIRCMVDNGIFTDKNDIAPHITFIAPRVVTNPEAFKDPEIQDKAIEGFKGATVLMMPYINLQYVGVGLFCSKLTTLFSTQAPPPP